MKFYYLHDDSIGFKYEPVFDGANWKRYAHVSDTEGTPLGRLRHCDQRGDDHIVVVDEHPNHIRCSISSGVLPDIFFSIHHLLIENRIANDLKAINPLGMNFGPIKCFGKRDISSDYQYIYSNKYVNIDAKRSHTRVRWRCKTCGAVDYRKVYNHPIFFDEGDYDGSDIFHIYGGWGFFVISQTVANVIIGHKPKGVIITPIEKMVRLPWD